MSFADKALEFFGLPPTRTTRVGLALEEARATRNEGLAMGREAVSMMMQYSLALEDRGWIPRDGFSREKDSANLTMEAVKGAYHNGRAIGQGNPIVASSIDKKVSLMLSKPVRITGADDIVKKNRATVFGFRAQAENIREKATGGNIMWILHPATQEIEPIPFEEIKGIVVNPQKRTEVWFYYREWQDEYHAPGTGQITTVKREMLYPQKDLNVFGVEIPDVLYGKPVFQYGVMMHVAGNKLGNQIWGTPDILSGIFYSGEHKELIEAYDSILRAQSTYAVQYRSKTKKAFDAVEAFIGTPGSSVYGQSQNLGPEIEMQLMKGIGAGMDFKTLDPIAAMSASVLGVPIDIVLGYEKASDALPTVMTTKMTTEQLFWADVYTELFDYFGKRKVKIFYPAIDPDPTHRQIQSIAGIVALHLISPQQAYGLIKDTFAADWEDKVPDPHEWDEYLSMAATQTNAPGSTEPSGTTVTPGQGQQGQIGPLADGDHELRDEGLQDHTRK